jgi:hypothetical protein
MVGSDDDNEGEIWDKYSETFDVNDKERQHKQQSSKKIIRVIAPSKLKIEDKDSEINAEIKVGRLEFISAPCPRSSQTPKYNPPPRRVTLALHRG